MSILKELFKKTLPNVHNPQIEQLEQYLTQGTADILAEAERNRQANRELTRKILEISRKHGENFIAFMATGEPRNYRL